MSGLPTEVKKFLSNNSLATIATISKDADYPHVIPVYYLIDGSNLYFASHKDSKTLHNILSNHHITISITESENLTSLQLRGMAEVAGQKSEIIEKLLTLADEKSKDSMAPMQQLGVGSMQVVAFITHWYKLSNYSGTKPVFSEGTLQNQT